MGKIAEWFFNPLVEAMYNVRDILYSPGTEPAFLPNLPEGEKVYKFRPQTFEEYIGQEHSKDTLKSYIAGAKQRNTILPHILIDGFAGCGKTTLAKIIANEMGAKFVECIASDLKDTIDLEFKIEEADGGIIFIDEIHSLSRDTVEGIYTIMEDFTHQGKNIKPFTLIGATTELGELLETRKPFVHRFELPIHLDTYTPENISVIAKQYKQHTFPNDIITPFVYEMVSKNSRNTPRIAIRLIKATIYLNGDINRVLRNFRIIKDGYTLRDLKVLRYIARNKKGVGVEGLASYMQTSKKNYIYESEPYLLINDLIVRTPRGRKITPEGIEKIEELSNVIKEE